VRGTLRDTHTCTPPLLATPSHRNNSSRILQMSFICISEKKNLRTIWAELGEEFPEIFNLCTAQSLENAARQQELDRPITEAEENRHKAGTPMEKIAEERIWNKRPDGLAIKMPTTEKLGEFVILEFKRMSDVTDQYVSRAKHVVEAQYASTKETRIFWDVEDDGYTTKETRIFWDVEEDGYTRLNTRLGEVWSDPDLPLSSLSKLGSLTTLGVQRRRKRREMYSINLHTLHTLRRELVRLYTLLDWSTLILSGNKSNNIERAPARPLRPSNINQHIHTHIIQRHTHQHTYFNTHTHTSPTKIR
jgi:hypothetical protein